MVPSRRKIVILLLLSILFISLACQPGVKLERATPTHPPIPPSITARMQNTQSLPATLPPTRATTIKTMKIPANQRFTETGIIVAAGQTITFQASGKINTNDGRPESDTPSPAGQNTPCQPISGTSKCLINGVNYGALVGKIANNPTFYVGTGVTIIAPLPGMLSLGVNDIDSPESFEDNQGAFDVTIEVK